MRELSALEEKRRNEMPPQGKSVQIQDSHTASREMCTFLIINVSSLQLIPVNIIAYRARLQLIPVNIIAYRARYGSVDPTAIVGPAILATAVSTAVAVIFCKIMDYRRGVS